MWLNKIGADKSLLSGEQLVVDAASPHCRFPRRGSEGQWERDHIWPKKLFLIGKEMGDGKESSPWIILWNRGLQKNAHFRCLSSFSVSQLDEATTLVFDPIRQWGLTMQWFCSGENMSWQLSPKVLEIGYFHRMFKCMTLSLLRTIYIWLEPEKR